MINKDQISKGFYQHPQISNFISVKNYIFLHRNEKQYLLIRFSNDSEFTVDSMRLTILQLDAQNQTISKTTVQYEDLSFAPNTTYASPKGLAVDEKCCNFKILYNEVHSGHYCYTVRSNEVVVQYAPCLLAPPKSDQKQPFGYTGKFTVMPQKIGRPALLAWVAALAIIFCILLNIQHVHTKYADAIEKQRQEQAEEQEFPSGATDETEQNPPA